MFEGQRDDAVLMRLSLRENLLRKRDGAKVSMLALCEIPHDHYSRVANTRRTHSTSYFRLSRWSRSN
jgi:hypothetical protein